MPRRSDTSDLTCALDANPVLDRDNVYFSDQGWAYRHYKNTTKTEFCDEILVAGQALLDNGDPDTTADPFGTASPTFLVGDSVQSPEAGHQPGDGGAAVLALDVTESGSGYTGASGVTTTAITGSGTGLTVTTLDAAGLLVTATIDNGGDGYEVGDVVSVDGGTGGELTITSVDE
ncbi:hypothetical protein [Synechococcus phage S-N03]|uniref:Uncharacterized protein n=1 Tax=Synechococcus phage S-N03 TaxID=2718943 RepID=A0A6G8R622_9CAUD|nr:hypothetical protein PQC09_gp227 [Synechococcus phage S-N03]QIN96840.1 hypothetical protein [Synechococcus phage S-N03]